MSKTKPLSQTLIQEMADRIVERFHPEKIILFGSHARGDAGPDSDVDLLVVMPFEGSKREKQLEIRMALHHFCVTGRCPPKRAMKDSTTPCGEARSHGEKPECAMATLGDVHGDRAGLDPAPCSGGNWIRSALD